MTRFGERLTLTGTVTNASEMDFTVNQCIPRQAKEISILQIAENGNNIQRWKDRVCIVCGKNFSAYGDELDCLECAGTEN